MMKNLYQINFYLRLKITLAILGSIFAVFIFVQQSNAYGPYDDGDGWCPAAQNSCSGPNLTGGCFGGDLFWCSCGAGQTAYCDPTSISYWSCDADVSTPGSGGGVYMCSQNTSVCNCSAGGTISASQSSVNLNQSTSITWTSTNVNSFPACTVKRNGTTIATGGSGSVSSGSLSVNSNFNLQCSPYSPQDSWPNNITVSVAINPPTVDIKANGSDGPITIPYNTSATLAWTTTNSSSCTASGDWSGSKSATGGSESTGNLTASKTYTITCSGPNTSRNDSVIVNVDPAPVVSLTASPTTVSSGGSSTLTWTVSNATSCTASGDWSGSKSASGGSASTGALTASKTYTLTCTGTGGSDADSATVTVSAGATLAVSLTATPSSGPAPLSSVLSADVSGTAAGTINYNFWYNCSYTGTSLPTAASQCGGLTVPSAGSCVNTAGVGYKCNGVNTDPKAIPAYSYSSDGTYIAKVIVERDTASNAEDRDTVTVISGCVVAGSGTGLVGDFYDGINHNTLVSSGKTFANLGITSINQNPADVIYGTNWAGGPDTFSVRFTGQVQPRCSETYTFRTVGNDGFRVWINGVQIINEWTDNGANTITDGYVNMVAGQKYDIVYEYFDGTGDARSRLAWLSPSTPVEAIPQSQLYPPPQTLSVTLFANPASGATPLSTILSADPAGTAVGSINYNFWYDCNYAGADLAAAASLCGALTVPGAGACVETVGVGYKCNGVNTDPKGIPAHSYATVGNYTAKVIVERGTAPNAQATTPVTANAPSCTSATPDGVTIPFSQSTHDVYINGAANVSITNFGVWSDVNGQDDLTWYVATDQGGGIWKATINLSNHDYGTIYAHGYLTPGLPSQQYCDNADFTWEAPTLSVGLTAAPATGPAPHSSALTADVSGTAVGTINYNFWYNCTYTGTVLSTANSTCGTLTVPAAGACVNTPGVGYQCNGVNTDPQNVPSYSYSPAGTYTGKVIVERGTAPNAEARATVTVNPPCYPPPNFVSGSGLPSTVNPGDPYTISCDYAEVNNSIGPSDGGAATSCSWSGFAGTTATFNCTAQSSPGTYPHTCEIFNVEPSPDYCPRV